MPKLKIIFYFKKDYSVFVSIQRKSNMGYGPKDKLSIISLNSQRRGLQSMAPRDRPSYYQELFENAEPDICFLPGDDDRAKLNVVQGYSQFLIPNNEQTVLLYDNQNVQMKAPAVNLNSLCGDLPGLDLNQMVVPEVVVSTQQPTQRVVKEFNLVSWRYDFLQRTNGNLETIVERLIKFSQRLGWTTQKPVLIGGELNISYQSLSQIVNKLSKDNQEAFLNEMNPIMAQMSFLPSMTKSSLRDQRHLFMMNVIKCSGSSGSNGAVNTWESSQSTAVVADCFIASKQLQLAEATLMDVESVIGRKVCMPLLQSCKPIQTHIDIPVRPPRHHGG